MDIQSKTKELISIINNSNDSVQTQKRAITDLKRFFSIYLQECKLKGKNLSLEISSEIEKILPNYNSLKNFEGINEILSQVASEYLEMAESEPKYFKKAQRIHIDILGNPGTDSKNLPVEYIKEILSNKILNVEDLNKSDIINVLKEHGEDLSEDFQDLIEDIVMPNIQIDISNPDIATRKLQNPEILDVLSNLTASYKYETEFEKAQEILEKGLELIQFKDDYLYKSLKKDFDEINFINKNFDTINISNSSLDDFKNTIKNHLGIEAINSPTFVDPTIHKTRPYNPTPTPPGPVTPSSKMPFDKKCEAIYKLIENLKENFPDIALDELKVGKDRFDSYHIITLKNANFTILENFNDSNEAIYFIDNNILYAALQETKTDAKSKYPNQISSANHIKDFDQYVINITEKASDKLKYSPVRKSTKRSKPTIETITEPTLISTKETEDTKIVVDSTEDSKQDLNSIDLASLSAEELQKISDSYDDEISKTDAETAELESNIKALQYQHQQEAAKQKLMQEILAKRSELLSKLSIRDDLKTKESDLQKSLNDKQNNNKNKTDSNF